MRDGLMRDIWTRSLEALRTKLPRGHYEDLVRSVVYLGSGPGEVVLQVPGRVQRDWIVEHYLELLARELEDQAGHPLEIKLEIAARSAGRARKGRTPLQVRSLLPPQPGLVTSGTADPVLFQPDVARTSVPPSFESAPPPIQPEQPPAVGPALPAPAALLQRDRPGPAEGLAAEPELSGPRLNSRYTLQSFVIGPSNQMAHAACVGICKNPGRLYNPLFLYGDSGLGKTHLLQAVGHQVLRDRPNKRIVYRSTEDFINDFTRSLRNQRMDAFRRFYREECDVLLLDDVQFMSRKEQTQQEFFHTFEALLARGSQIVMSCDRLPREIDQLDERLRSRFTWGLLADIHVPELETRVAILHKKAELDGLPLDDDVALFLASSFRTNVRELEGSLTRLGAYASLGKRSTITLEFAREVLEEHLPRLRTITIEEAIKLVADFYRIRPADLKGERRHRNVARPRQVAMYLAREVLQRSFPEIGRAFSRDHTTVIAACRKVEELMLGDAALSSEVDSLKRRLSE